MTDGADDTRPSLLIVDDDELFSRVLKAAMQKRGFETRVAHDVTSAMVAAELESPEYAVIDLNMPGESGLDLHPARIDHPKHVI